METPLRNILLCHFKSQILLNHLSSQKFMFDVSSDNLFKLHLEKFERFLLYESFILLWKFCTSLKSSTKLSELDCFDAGVVRKLLKMIREKSVIIRRWNHRKHNGIIDVMIFGIVERLDWQPERTLSSPYCYGIDVERGFISVLNSYKKEKSVECSNKLSNWSYFVLHLGRFQFGNQLGNVLKLLVSIKVFASEPCFQLNDCQQVQSFVPMHINVIVLV